MKTTLIPFRGTFRVTPSDQPDYIRSGNALMSQCRIVGVGGNARARRRQVRQWKAQGLRVTPGHLPMNQCVVEERKHLLQPK